jgi:hypothetical protein
LHGLEKKGNYGLRRFVPVGAIYGFIERHLLAEKLSPRPEKRSSSYSANY